MCDPSNTRGQKLSRQEYVARLDKYIESFSQPAPRKMTWSDQPSFYCRTLSHPATLTALLSSNPILAQYSMPEILDQYNMPQSGNLPEPVAPLGIDLDLNSPEPEDPPQFANSPRMLRGLFPLNDAGHLEHRNDLPNTSSHSQPPQPPRSENRLFEGDAAQTPSWTHTQGLYTKHGKDYRFPVPAKKNIILGDPDSPTFRLSRPSRIRADSMPRKRKFDLAKFDSAMLDFDMYDGDIDDFPVPFIEVPQFKKCRRKIASNKRIKRAAKNDAKNDAGSLNPPSAINFGLGSVVNSTDEEDSFPLPYVHDGHVWRLRDSGPMEGWQVIPGKLGLRRQNKKILKQGRTEDKRRRGTNRGKKNEGEETKGDASGGH